jgi:hypothetical protein
MLRPMSAPHVSNGDVTFECWDEQFGKVHVTVSAEAIEDYADPRGMKGSLSQKLAAAFDDVVEAAGRVYDKDSGRPRRILVTTRDLNG